MVQVAPLNQNRRSNVQETDVTEEMLLLVNQHKKDDATCLLVWNINTSLTYI